VGVDDVVFVHRRAHDDCPVNVEHFHMRPRKRKRKHAGACEEPDCALPAIHCTQHCPYPQQLPHVRALIEDVIRDMEWDDPARMAPFIERLKEAL
jgi:hypothetical protein